MHINNGPAAREPYMGVEFIDRILYYAEDRESTLAKIFFYVVVFTFPAWFTLATGIKLVRGTYHLSRGLYRNVTSAHHSTSEKSK